MELRSLLDLEVLEEFKLHAARYNNIDQPLDIFIKDKHEWFKWNSWQSGKDDFNRKYILSMIRFYPEENTWLFGGIFKVIQRSQEKNAHSYTIELQEIGVNLIGRLKILGVLPRGRAFKLENVYTDLKIIELLKKPYAGEIFKGYENISLEFTMLETIFKNEPVDWKTALQSIKCI